MDNRIRPLLEPLCRLRFQDRLRTNGKCSFSREVQNGGQARDSGRHQGFPRRGEHLHLVLLPRHRAARAGRSRGLQVGEIHLHRRPDFVAGRTTTPSRSRNHLAQLLEERRTARSRRSSRRITPVLQRAVQRDEEDAAQDTFCNTAAATRQPDDFCFETPDDTPFFHHVATLVELYEARRSRRALHASLQHAASRPGEDGQLSSVTRISQSASSKTRTTPTRRLYKRLINLLSHGNYSLYEPREMMEENKELLPEDLSTSSSTRYPFNPALFPAAQPEATQQAS